MNNLERLKIAVPDINMTDDVLTTFLLENGLEPQDTFIPASATNKRQIMLTAIDVLTTVASSVQMMKSYKLDDLSVSDFHDNLRNQIADLEEKVRKMKTDEEMTNNTNTFMLFQ